MRGRPASMKHSTRAVGTYTLVSAYSGRTVYHHYNDERLLYIQPARALDRFRLRALGITPDWSSDRTARGSIRESFVPSRKLPHATRSLLELLDAGVREGAWL